MGRGWGDVLRHRVQNIFEDAGARRKGRKESAHESCVAQAPSPGETRQRSKHPSEVETGGNSDGPCTRMLRCSLLFAGEAPAPHRYRCGALPMNIIFTLAAKSGIGVQFLRF